MSLEEAATIALKDCFALKDSERVLILYTETKKELADAFEEAAKKTTSQVTSKEIPEPIQNGAEPTEEVAEMMKDCNVLLLVTAKSLSHTNARINASKTGIRCASMPNITKEMMLRCIPVDYQEMKLLTKKVQDLLSNGKSVQITTEEGTDITFDIEGRSAIDDCGNLQEPGSFDNLPAGEAFIAPMENKTQGVYVVDGSQAGVPGILKEPIKCTVENGLVTKIEGGNEAKKFQEVLDAINDKNAFNIAELGIGTNPHAIITGVTLEDEKIKGTCHIALGTNTSFGGTVKTDIHVDGVIKNPTIVIDDQKIMEKGEFLI